MSQEALLEVLFTSLLFHAVDSSSAGRSVERILGDGKLRPLSLPKPTIILPFSHSKTMTILKDGHMKPVTFLCALYTYLHACTGARTLLNPVLLSLPDNYSSFS